jgi:hypothetical protein
MSDFKSKLPDLKELGSMASKLFNGLKTAIKDIAHDYKKKREVVDGNKPAANAPIKEKATSKPASKPAAKSTSEKKVVKKPRVAQAKTEKK